MTDNIVDIPTTEQQEPSENAMVIIVEPDGDITVNSMSEDAVFNDIQDWVINLIAIGMSNPIPLSGKREYH